MSILTAAEWDEFLLAYPDAHVLQTSAWGDFKADFGWQVERVCIRTGQHETGAQVLFRRLPLGFSIAYIPKGPVGPNWMALWPELDRICQRRHAIMLKVEPDAWELPGNSAIRGLEDQFVGFTSAGEPIQPRRTVVIDLTGSEEEWLARMKQKTRYNVRLAEKKGITIRETQDLDAFYQMMQITGERDGFGVHSLEYFTRAYQLFYPAGMCALLMAEYAGHPLAGLMVFARGQRAWYFYGASNDEERNRMPTYFLQWEAMRWARAHGCTAYDLWGVPDADEPVLEDNFMDRSDGLWGVYRFKRGFGGELKRTAGAWDKAFLPLVYPLYSWWQRRKSETT
jgi:peptidoglycan pentaglycine glycine transferase (the first glycine)